MELKELNCLSKHMKNVRSNQTCISMNFVLNSAKNKFFHVSIVKLEHLHFYFYSYLKIERLPVQTAMGNFGLKSPTLTQGSQKPSS